MRKILIVAIFLFLSTCFTSCAVVYALLGYEECNYPDCKNECVENCNYCSTHCDIYNVSKDFDKKVHQSLNKQMEQYRDDQKRSLKK